MNLWEMHYTVGTASLQEDIEKLIGDYEVDHKLIVLDVGVKHFGPCVKNCVDAVQADGRQSVLQG